MDQLARTLFADARNARNIIRGIALNGLDVDELLRFHAVRLLIYASSHSVTAD